ncbi:hypothetical protein ACFL04_02845 [Patescibacteria group bacterium]
MANHSTPQRFPGGETVAQKDNAKIVEQLVLAVLAQKPEKFSNENAFEQYYNSQLDLLSGLIGTYFAAPLTCQSIAQFLIENKVTDVAQQAEIVAWLYATQLHRGLIITEAEGSEEAEDDSGTSAGAGNDDQGESTIRYPTTRHERYAKKLETFIGDPPLTLAKMVNATKGNEADLAKKAEVPLWFVNYMVSRLKGYKPCHPKPIHVCDLEALFGELDKSILETIYQNDFGAKHSEVVRVIGDEKIFDKAREWFSRNST